MFACARVCVLAVFCSDVRDVGVSMIHREQLHKGLRERQSEVIKMSKNGQKGRTRITVRVGGRRAEAKSKTRNCLTEKKKIKNE